MGQPCDDQVDTEADEREGGADLDGPLGQPGTQLPAHDDGEGVGGDHAERRTDPGADRFVVGCEGNRGEPGLVAEFGEEEDQGDGPEHGTTGSPGPGGIAVGQFVTAHRPSGST